jgi:peptidoglycan/xylan/chitin deacetylase (PgdA/CDA1 family)
VSEGARSLSAVIGIRALGHALLETLDSLEHHFRGEIEIVLVAGSAGDPRALRALQGLAARSGRRFAARPEEVAWAELPGNAMLLLDAGDILTASFFERAASALAADPALGAATSRVRSQWPSGRDELLPLPATDRARLLADPWAASRAALCRRDALLAVGPPDSGLHPFEGADLWLRLLAAGWGIAAIDEPLLLRRPRAPSSSELPADAAAGLAALAQRHLVGTGREGPGILIDCQRRLEEAAGAHPLRLERRDGALDEIACLEREIGAARVERSRWGLPSFDWGELRRTAPVSREWGEDRGKPIDRFYIEAFVEMHREDLRGAVLEVQEPGLTERFGGGAIERIDVVDVEASNPRATLLADLRNAAHIEDSSFDCFVLTQTLHVIADVPAVLREARRILRPGGVLLATFPTASRVCVEYGREGDFWRATEAGVRELFRAAFADHEISLHAYGNLLTSVAFLEGMACHELDAAEFAPFDPWYPLLFGVRAVKSPELASSARPRPVLAVSERPPGTILLYHRVARAELDPHHLALSPELFSEQMQQIARSSLPLPLADFVAAARAGSLPAGAVAVTLDDAYRDNLDHASPILLAHGVPATFFAVSGAGLGGEVFWWDALAERLLGPGARPPELVLRLDGGEHRFATDSAASRRGAHDVLHARLVECDAAARDAVLAQLASWAGDAVLAAPRPLDAAGLRELAARPGHAIGAHGVDHLALSRQPPEAQEREIAESKRVLEAALGSEIRDFSYPYGDVCASVARRVRAAGYASAVCCEAGGVGSRSDPWRLPRLEIHAGNADRFAALLSSLAAPRR